ncbi:tetraacyldisaccharide 4'-kinase [Nitratifractor salsuginis]|uniref:Tetraacyldisaccharide 4'-kinase n=1 Tax=Nitratifractor salsuginis (strain DSM 16511 / JCM 12458 / E9I37-1) TaxID=749222 RepID=E6X077_NITSE|nr:tetraacyldisaccharide 4'-kinase [Nitratifractor salsuginis]ADV45666.1 tetraacyldisaccharide 4'-kinase [Nitratifractor salsuginis DSM 16511]
MQEGRGIEAFAERLFYRSGLPERILSTLLSPLGWGYGSVMWLRRHLARRRSFGLPIISVGNLVVGGSGKTPFVIALASRYENVWIVSRGYGRQSRGMVQVSRRGEILCPVEASGDEAMEMALALPEASVLVSKNRSEGIRRAVEEGAELVILDDGFNRVEIEKFEILLEPEVLPNCRVLPAGPFREFPSTAAKADLQLKEGREYRRRVRILDPAPRMLLATSIARPERLKPWLPEEVVGHYRLPDHHWFDEKALAEALRRHRADSLLVTGKDAVKMQGFQLPLSVMELQLEIDSSVFEAVECYLKEFHAAQD